MNNLVKCDSIDGSIEYVTPRGNKYRMSYTYYNDEGTVYGFIILVYQNEVYLVRVYNDSNTVSIVHGVTLLEIVSDLGIPKLDIQEDSTCPYVIDSDAASFEVALCGWLVDVWFNQDQ